MNDDEKVYLYDRSEMLKRQRDTAEEERDEWKLRAMQSEQQRQALRAECNALRVLLKRVPSVLNSAFWAGAEECENGSARRQEKYMEPVYALRKDIAAALAVEHTTGGGA